MDAENKKKVWLLQMAIVFTSLSALADDSEVRAAQSNVVEMMQVDLPLRTDSEANSEVRSTEPVVAVAAISSLDLDLSLDQPVSVSKESFHFQLNRLHSPSGKQAWNVMLCKNASADNQEPDVPSSKASLTVGKFYTQTGELMFAWTDANSPSQAEQLRNCVLSIRQGANVQRVALRACKFIEPIKLDFDLLSQKIELPQLALPSVDSLFLQILHVDNFRVSTEQQPADGVVPANKFVKIQLVDWKFPAEVRVKLGKSRGKVVAVVMANYKLDKRWRPMTVKHVDRTMTDIRRSLQKNAINNRRYRAGLTELPKEISYLIRCIQNSDNAFDRNEWGRQLVKAKRYLTKARGGVRKTNNMIQELKARIHHLKALSQLGNKIHKKGKIHFRVGIRTENGEVDLLRTTNEPEKLAANN